MKVIFLEDVPQVARAGDVKEVAEGFGRNYLLPRRLARLATAGAVKQLEEQRHVVARRETKLEHQSEGLSAQMGQLALTIQARVGRQGRLYGSVTSGHIAEELSRAIGESIDRRKIELEAPIRQTGTYQVPVKLGPNAEAVITVVVQGEGETPQEPAVQAGEAVPEDSAPPIEGEAGEPEEVSDQER